MKREVRMDITKFVLEKACSFAENYVCQALIASVKYFEEIVSPIVIFSSSLEVRLAVPWR